METHTKLITAPSGEDSEYYAALGLFQTTKRLQEIPRVVSLFSPVLEKSIRRNERMIERSKRKDVMTMFHGLKAPGLSTKQYLERIYKYSNCSSSCFVVAHIYMDRFLSRTRAYLTSLNVHRLLITSVMLAAKFIDRESSNNAHYAKVGGISRAEMNRLEIEFLFCLDFRLHVTPETFRKYCVKLEEEAAMEINPIETSSVQSYRNNLTIWPKQDGAKSRPLASHSCRTL